MQEHSSKVKLYSQFAFFSFFSFLLLPPSFLPLFLFESFNECQSQSCSSSSVPACRLHISPWGRGRVALISPPFQAPRLLCLSLPQASSARFLSSAASCCASYFLPGLPEQFYSRQHWEPLLFSFSKDTFSYRRSRILCLIIWFLYVNSNPLLRSFHYSLACVLQPLCL